MLTDINLRQATVSENSPPRLPAFSLSRNRYPYGGNRYSNRYRLIFGPQPLIGYSYGAKNKKRLKEVLSFDYKFEILVAVAFVMALSVLAKPILQVFTNDATIVKVGVPMLRLQQLGMAGMAIVLVTTCVFQSTGKAFGAFLLSVSRQGVIFAVVLIVASSFLAYYGILASQAISDLLTAVLAIFLYRKYLSDTSLTKAFAS